MKVQESDVAGKARNGALDVLKVFATIFIVFHHYQQDGQGITGNLFHCFVDFYGGTFYWGYMVELFFVISGFCIFPYIYKIKDGMRFYSFYARRASRLLPLMAISGIICAGLLVLYNRLYSGNDYYLGTPSIFGIVLQSLGVQDGWVFSNPSLNNPTWYCSVLLLCYIVFYGIVRLAQRWNFSPLTGALFMVLLGCGISTYGINLPFLNASSCRGFYAFFTGVLLAAAMPRIRAWPYAMPLSLSFLVITVAAFKLKGGQLAYFPYLLTFMVYPAAIIVLDSPLFGSITRWELWGKWAKICYSIFIWHFPAYLLLFLILPILGIDPANVANQTAMLVFACAMQPIGWLSYRFLESPLNRWTSNLFSAWEAKYENATT